jgi:hypothetical protein
MPISRRELRNRPIFVALPPFSSSHDDELWGVGLSDPDEKSPDSSDDRFENNGDVTDKEADVNNEDDIAQRTQPVPAVIIAVESEAARVHAKLLTTHKPGQRGGVARRDPFSPDKDIVKAPKANQRHPNKAIPTPPTRSHVTTIERLFATRLHWNLSQWREESELQRHVARRGNRPPRTQRDSPSSSRTQARLSSPVSKTIPSSRVTSSSTAAPSYLPGRGLPSTSGNIPQRLSNIASSSRVRDPSSLMIIDESNPTRNTSFAIQVPLNRRTHSRQALNSISPGSTFCLGIAPSVAGTASRLSRGRPKMPDQVATLRNQLREFQRETAVIGAEDTYQLRDTRLREIPHGCTADAQRQPLEDSQGMLREREGVADNLPSPATNPLSHRSISSYPIASMQHNHVFSELAMVGGEVYIQEGPSSIAEYDYQSSDPHHGLQEVSDMRPVTRITLRHPSTSQQPAHQYTSTTGTTVKPYQAYVEDADSYIDPELHTAAFEQQFVSDKVVLTTPETHKHAMDVERHTTTGAEVMYGRPEGRPDTITTSTPTVVSHGVPTSKSATCSLQIEREIDLEPTTRQDHTQKETSSKSKTSTRERAILKKQSDTENHLAQKRVPIKVDRTHLEETYTCNRLEEARVRIEEIHTEEVRPSEPSPRVDTETSNTVKTNTGESRTESNLSNPAHTKETRTAYYTLNIAPGEYPWNESSATRPTTEPERRFIWLRKSSARTEYPTPNMTPDYDPWNRPSAAHSTTEPERRFIWLKNHPNRIQDIPAKEMRRRGTRTEEVSTEQAHAEAARTKDACVEETCTEEIGTEEAHVDVKDAHNMDAHSVDTRTEHSRTEKYHIKQFVTREAHTNNAHTKEANTGVPTSKKTTLSRPAFMLFVLVISLLALGSSVLCAIILDTLGGVA